MALSAQILDFILTQSNRTCKLYDIVKGTNNDKKSINKELYKLQRQGVVEKVKDSPPVWTVSAGAHGSHERVGGSKAFQKTNPRIKGAVTKRKSGTSRKPYAQAPNPELIPKIVSYLQSSDQAVRTIDLAKHCGLRTSTEINPTLYNLCRRKVIRQASCKPALWCRAPMDEVTDVNVYLTGGGDGQEHTESMETEDMGSQRGIVTYQEGKKPIDFKMNITKSEENAIKSLMHDDSIVIRPADKGSGIVIMDDDTYKYDIEQELLIENQKFSSGVHSFPQSSAFVDGLEHSIVAHTDKLSDQPSGYSNSHNDDVLSNNTFGSNPTNSTYEIMQDDSVGRDRKTVNSSDIDRLLFAMLLCPNNKAKSFVIGTKMKPRENLKTVQNILEESQRLGFVDTSELLWTVTEEGQKYIKRKLEQDSLPSAPRQSIIPPPARDLSKKFVGPPPTPLDILKSGQSYPSGNAPGSYQGNKSSSNLGVSLDMAGADAVMAPSSLPSAQSAPGSYQPPISNFGYRTDSNRSPFISRSSSLTSSSSDIPSLMSIQTRPPQNMQKEAGAYSSPSYMQLEGNSRNQPSKMLSNQGSFSVNVNATQNVHAKLSSSNALSFDSQIQKDDDNTPTSMQMRGIDRNKGSSNATFKPPPPPMELLSEQMKKTDISPPNSYSSPAGFSQPVCQSMMSTNQGTPQDLTALSSGPIQTRLPLEMGHSMPKVCETYAVVGIHRLLNAARSLPQTKVIPVGNSGSQLTQSSSHNLLQGQGHISLQGQGHIPSQPQSLPAMPSPAMASLPSGPSSIGISSESFAALSKNPVSALMEYAQSRKSVATIEVIRQSGPSHKPRFVMGAFIGGKQLSEVACTNKKDGRKEAADKALRALIAAGQYKVDSTTTTPQIPASQMTHFDKMAALTHQAFNSLSVTIAESFSGRKVIAGLVMKTSQDPGTVIAIGTGNRCITGTELSLEGNTVNDSHAEIITRRGFIRFLYKQLLSYEPSKSQQMFVPSSSGKLRVRDGISFHLYISTAPCGDGALFSSRDAAATSAPPQNVKGTEHDPAFTSDVQGLLRTKIEGGEGTIPIEKDFVAQTFDGIQRGERLRTMSCSDKICRWNVVGMQGALLSHFLEPIYLESLTLGTLYDHRHLARAVCCRVAKDGADVNSMLPSGFKLNHPWLGRVTVCEVPRETQKTKSLSLNWCYGDTKAEVTDGTKGLCFTSIEKTLFSRCSKRSLYDSFQQVCKKFSRQDLADVSNYNDAKLKANDFVSAKKVLFSKMAEYKYGPWVSKPVEEEMFS